MRFWFLPFDFLHKLIDPAVFGATILAEAAEKLWLRAKECACDGSISQVEATCRDLHRTERSFGWDGLNFRG
jgi:hypothetical protein